MLKFTEQEKELIVANATKIQNYLEIEVVPKITQRIIIGFGGTHQNPRGYEMIDKYRLFIAPKDKPLEVYTGFGLENNDKAQMTLGITECFSHIEPIQGQLYNDERQVRYEGIYQIIQNWSIIKSKILAEVEKQQQEQNILNNFEI
jgi:hypothetical protein